MLLQHSAFLIALGFVPRRPDASKSGSMFCLGFFIKVTKSSCRGRLKENQNTSCWDQLILKVKNLKSITSKKHHLNEKLWKISAVPCYT